MSKRLAGLLATAAVLLPLAAGAAAPAVAVAGTATAPQVAGLQVAAVAPGAEQVLATYADIAHAAYSDALTAARALKTAVDALVANPTEETLANARRAWIAARVPYQQTETFRFGNPLVDEWEGKVNAWPLDEGLIDYVDASYGAGDENPFAKANVIANTAIKAGDKTIDATTIDKKLLAEDLHEAGGVEANVATGYHAIEFLLWGQDLNGTGPGAGDRKATDYAREGCTNGHCDRRAAYLQAATDLLIDDLTEMVEAWAPGGAARTDIARAGEKDGIARILTGIGSLSYGELAGERMKLGLILHDPEEEHDCFSDNTHNSHYYNQIGMVNVYTGQYRRPDGSVVRGPSLSAYVAARAPEEDARVRAAMTEATAALERIKTTADSGEMAYDQMIGAGNEKGNALVSEGIDRLVAQKNALEGVVAKLGLTIHVEGSDSLDNPSAVQ
ncbi:imelysin family protein [Azospirillum halopraeferens]|uniref:imelysin family protein n=1 Tax=Azospirillum halopraeferens TaxID=34010 RepID=UPI000415277D|nr:imelysin family protein [Azospirillum halopraeferens]